MVNKVIKLDNGRWAKNCPSCGEQQTYLRKNYAESSLRENKSCKRCSNREVKNSNRGWHKGIRISWFNKFKTSANLRGIVFKITIDYISELYSKQDKKCALTNRDITFPKIGHPNEADCSIDRIDSKKGYVKGNVQLVTKQVNMMKQQYSQKDFIDVCIDVAKNNKQWQKRK